MLSWIKAAAYFALHVSFLSSTLLPCTLLLHELDSQTQQYVIDPADPQGWSPAQLEKKSAGPRGTETAAGLQEL